MKREKSFLSILMFLVFSSSLALANGLNLNSLGSRALAMGGAFVGLADDFSAVYWNPAGIAQFDRQYFGFYGTDIIPSGTYRMDILVPDIGSVTLVNAETETTHYLAGLAGYYYPINENMVTGLGIYVPSGLGNRWNGEDFAPISNNDPSLEWKSRIGLVTISPAVAYKINEQFMVGAALNINYGRFNVAMHAGSAAIPEPPYQLDLGQYEESMDGWGFGAAVGLLVKPSEMVSVGATFRTANTVKFSGDASISNLSLLGVSATSEVEREITWPMWIAGGVAVKPREDLTITGDIQWTQWSKIDVIESDFTDPFWQQMMAQSGDDEMQMHWEDAWQIRFGAEYRIENMAFRGGFYMDPSPAPDRTMNVLIPSYDYNVITLGFGYNLDGLQIDVGFEYLMGKEREVPYEKWVLNPEWQSAMPGIYDMNIVVPNVSVSYSF
ncbi:MAG: OmpP1/FadL family transporter [Candidatus Aminicenantes bacterium]